MEKLSLLSVLELFLPKELLDYFKLTDSNKEGDILHLYFEELITPPLEFKDLTLNSHGFYEEITVQDFPIRGHQVFFHIKRRRWKDLQSGNIVSRDWNLVASTTRLTQEFASFLKEFNRY
jgi:hypothetical protein